MQAIEELEKGLAHLESAEEKLRDIPQTRRLGKALARTIYAVGYTSSALDLLRQEKEEPCNKP